MTGQTLPTGAVLGLDHNPWGLVKTSTQNAAPIAAVTFDGDGRQIFVEGPVVANQVMAGVSAQLRVQTQYSIRGHVAKVIESDAQNASVPTHETQFLYDRQGREVSSTAADAGVIVRDFDLNGNVVEVCDAEANCIGTVYNSNNQATTSVVVNYNNSGSDAQISSLIYDDAGRVISQTNAFGTVTEFGYDQADRQLWSTILDFDDTGRNVRISEVVYDDAGRQARR